MDDLEGESAPALPPGARAITSQCIQRVTEETLTRRGGRLSSTESTKVYPPRSDRDGQSATKAISTPRHPKRTPSVAETHDLAGRLADVSSRVASEFDEFMAELFQHKNEVPRFLSHKLWTCVSGSNNLRTNSRRFRTGTCSGAYLRQQVIRNLGVRLLVRPPMQ